MGDWVVGGGVGDAFGELEESSFLACGRVYFGEAAGVGADEDTAFGFDWRSKYSRASVPSPRLLEGIQVDTVEMFVDTCGEYGIAVDEWC